jgi:beta-1,2-mannobiose phosphorylase / 1,2-beta-oligomannan phosphorylase
MLHRALFPGTLPEETVCQDLSRQVDLDRESIWISYCPMPPEGFEPHRPGLFNSHHRLATPVSPWERLKIGGGTPPVLIRQGWLIIYHGVSEIAKPGSDKHQLCYSAGLMVLAKKHPREILYRSAAPVLKPESPQEARGQSPTSCFLPASTGATISAHQTASMFITEWLTAELAWLVLTCRSSYR